MNKIQDLKAKRTKSVEKKRKQQKDKSNIILDSPIKIKTNLFSEEKYQNSTNKKNKIFSGNNIKNDNSNNNYSSN